MNIQVTDTHEGKYLIIDHENETVELETKLIESLDNRYILKPVSGNGIDGILRYNVSGCEPITAYLTNRRLDRLELVGILAQMKSVIRALEDHMLTDANILFDPDHVYIDRATRKVRFVPVCRLEGEFGERLRPLMETLFCHADMEDTESLRFAARMMRTVLEGNLKMHTLMELAETNQPAAKTKHPEQERPESRQEKRPENASHVSFGEEATILLSDLKEPVKNDEPGPAALPEEDPPRGVKGFFSGFAAKFKDDDDDDE